jgi:predicted amidohydrolase
VTIAANMEPYGADHELVGRVRALDNRRAHVYVNLVGDEGDLRFVGGSQVVAAGRQVLANLGRRNRSSLYDLDASAGLDGDSDTDYLNLVTPDLPTRSLAADMPETVLG